MLQHLFWINITINKRRIFGKLKIDSRLGLRGDHRKGVEDFFLSPIGLRTSLCTITRFTRGLSLWTLLPLDRFEENQTDVTGTASAAGERELTPVLSSSDSPRHKFIALHGATFLIRFFFFNYICQNHPHNMTVGNKHAMHI